MSLQRPHACQIYITYYGILTSLMRIQRGCSRYVTICIHQANVLHWLKLMTVVIYV